MHTLSAASVRACSACPCARSVRVCLGAHITTFRESPNKHSNKIYVSPCMSLLLLLLPCLCPTHPPPPPHFKACGPFSILVLKGFFVSQAICPSLFGVQTVVKYPVTDPECCEWQLLSGQLAVVPRNIPERII